MIIDDNLSIHHDFIKILKTESFEKLDVLSAELFGESRENRSLLPQFEIDVASQGQEGVELIKKALDAGVHYALAFVDIRMPPGWDGIETIKHIWALDKNIQIVICTAYSDYSWEETVQHLGKTDNLLILKKPFDNVSVRQLACALTTKWQLAEKAQQYTTILQKQVADRTLSLEKSLALVKSTFESSSDGILVINNEGNIIDYNQKMISMLKIPPDVLATKSQEKVLEYLKNKLQDPEDFFSKIKEMNKNPDEIRIQVIQFKNGNVFECYSQPHKLNNQIIGHILDFRDITKRAKLEQELQHQATHDPLTGLGNRLKLLEGIKIAINVSKQTQKSFSVFFLDFDRFKLINDSFSHNAGDELLREAAGRLKTVIRSEDILARLGGDEFVIIFMNIDNKVDIEAKAKTILKLFEQPFSICDRQVIITASIGICIHPENGTTADSLLRNADAAMYQAKAQKGNNFQFYTTEMSMQSLAELDQELELRQALKNNEFFLYYQPQHDLNSDKLVALEALIRWQHPTKGVLLPIDFIPNAEELGLTVQIGEWTLRTACLQNKKWQDEGILPVRIAINVSEQQLKQKNYFELVKNILQETGLKPEYLEIELTENIILSNNKVVQAVNELKSLGIIISIDDFGTGYSSLSYLHKLPIDRLKIDASFVQHIHSASDDEVIIRAIIAMAKSLNLEVLAEGVESIDQLNFLKKIKCGDVQGFYFSKPLSDTEIKDYLVKHAKKNKKIL